MRVSAGELCVGAIGCQGAKDFHHWWFNGREDLVEPHRAVPPGYSPGSSPFALLI